MSDLPISSTPTSRFHASTMVVSNLVLGLSPYVYIYIQGTCLHHKEIKAAQGIKIPAQGLEQAIAGTALYVVGPYGDSEDIKEAAMEDMKSVLRRIDKSGEGVGVQASILGPFEALREFLKSPAVKMPVSGINIGPVHKKDVMKASVMLEKKRNMAIDVKVTLETQELADEAVVKIFIADIIYHLFDQFKAYIDNFKNKKKNEASKEAFFTCVLKIMLNCVFNKSGLIVLGVMFSKLLLRLEIQFVYLRGSLLILVELHPLGIVTSQFIMLKRVRRWLLRYEISDKKKKKKKVVGSNPVEQQKMFSRHFVIEDELVSHISRKSIDMLKANYWDDLSIDEWKLVLKLKNLFKIQ